MRRASGRQGRQQRERRHRAEHRAGRRDDGSDPDRDPWSQHVGDRPDERVRQVGELGQQQQAGADQARIKQTVDRPDLVHVIGDRHGRGQRSRPPPAAPASPPSPPGSTARGRHSAPSLSQGTSVRAAPHPAATNATANPASTACGSEPWPARTCSTIASTPAITEYGTATASAADNRPALARCPR